MIIAMIIIIIIIIPIGALRSISKGGKTWFGKPEVPDLLRSVQVKCRSVVSLSYGEFLRHNKHYPVEYLTTGENGIIIIIIIIIIMMYKLFECKENDWV